MIIPLLTYADERLFKPDPLSSPLSSGNTRDKETIARNKSLIRISSFAEHSNTLILLSNSKIDKQKYIIHQASSWA